MLVIYYQWSFIVVYIRCSDMTWIVNKTRSYPTHELDYKGRLYQVFEFGNEMAEAIIYDVEHDVIEQELGYFDTVEQAKKYCEGLI